MSDLQCMPSPRPAGRLHAQNARANGEASPQGERQAPRVSGRNAPDEGRSSAVQLPLIRPAGTFSPLSRGEGRRMHP